MGLPETLVATLFSSLTEEPPWLSFLHELEHHYAHHATHGIA